MAALTGRIDFPGASVWVSYGVPTEMDNVGCNGLYVERVEITNAPLYLLYLEWCKVWEVECFPN